MAANWGIVRGTVMTPARQGPLWRAANWLKRWVGVEPRLGSKASTSAPEHEHHARFSAAELDACIEHSLSGDVDREAPPQSEKVEEPDPAGAVRKKRRGQPAPAPRPPAEEARAFGGDLYPTAAHGVGRHVRYVRVKTWLGAGATAPESRARTQP